MFDIPGWVVWLTRIPIIGKYIMKFIAQIFTIKESRRRAALLDIELEKQAFNKKANDNVQIITDKMNEIRPHLITTRNLESIEEYYKLEPEMKSKVLTILLELKEVKPSGFGDYYFIKQRFDNTIDNDTPY